LGKCVPAPQNDTGGLESCVRELVESVTILQATLRKYVEAPNTVGGELCHGFAQAHPVVVARRDYTITREQETSMATWALGDELEGLMKVCCAEGLAREELALFAQREALRRTVVEFLTLLIKSHDADVETASTQTHELHEQPTEPLDLGGKAQRAGGTGIEENGEAVHMLGRVCRDWPYARDDQLPRTQGKRLLHRQPHEQIGPGLKVLPLEAESGPRITARSVGLQPSRAVCTQLHIHFQVRNLGHAGDAQAVGFVALR